MPRILNAMTQQASGYSPQDLQAALAQSAQNAGNTAAGVTNSARTVVATNDARMQQMEENKRLRHQINFQEKQLVASTIMSGLSLGLNGGLGAMNTAMQFKSLGVQGKMADAMLAKYGSTEKPVNPTNQALEPDGFYAGSGEDK